MIRKILQSIVHSVRCPNYSVTREENMRTIVRRLSCRRGTRVLWLLSLMLAFWNTKTALAQSLNWEGQTGVFVTPLAYTVPSPLGGVAWPAVAYHYLNGGTVLGGFHQASVTSGAFDRLEFGYTRDFHESGTTTGLSNLWGSGFNVFHGKVKFVTETRRFRPALSVGFVVRSEVPNVGGILRGQNNTNEDFYVVGTKTVTAVRKVPLVFNVGWKATNASLLGLAGNAPAMQGRFFGAVGLAIPGPKRSTILFGSEALQEPRSVQGLPGVDIPTTMTYAVRFFPGGAMPLRSWGVEKPPHLVVDFGVAQAVGTVAPGVDLRAREQFALGISYGF